MRALPLLLVPAALMAGPRRIGEEIRFEPNVGQMDKAVLFTARSPAGTAFITRTGAVFPLDGGAVTLRLAESNAGRLVPEEKLPGVANYLLGSDPKTWHTGIPGYARLLRKGVAPGVDMVYRGSGSNLEFDLVVAPGADPAKLEMVYDGAASVRADGEDIVVRSVGGGELRQHRPVVYQTVDGRRAEVPAKYRVRGRRIGVEVGRYDKRSPLVIDPVISFSTLLTGQVTGLAVDSTGNCYITGTTYARVVQGVIAEYFSFVAKFSREGRLVYWTRLGPGNGGLAAAIAVDSGGAAYVTGTTSSREFPVVNPFRASLSGGNDAFVLKLSSSGDQILFSTYFGGGGLDSGNGITVDPSGSVMVVGGSSSPDLPSVHAFPFAARAGAGAAFAAKFTPAGNGLLFASYLQGTDSYSRAVEVVSDSGGAAHILGVTNSERFPLVRPLQDRLNRGSGSRYKDMFVQKIAPNKAGSMDLVYSTYLGGSLDEEAGGLAVGLDGAVYVGGTTNSRDYPVVRPYRGPPPQTALGPWAGVVTKIAPDGAVAYSTYLSDLEGPPVTGIGLGPTGTLAVSSWGYGLFHPIPVVSPPVGLPPYPASGTTAILVVLSAAGDSAQMSAYIGGAEGSRASRVAVDAEGGIWLAGEGGQDFPQVYGLPVEPLAGAFLLKVDPDSPSGVAEILAPAARQTLTSGGATLAWRPVAGAAGYKVRVFRYDGTTTRTVPFFETVMDGGHSSALVTLANGDYYAGVSVCRTIGAQQSSCGPESFREFSVARPSPAGVPTVAAPNAGASLTSSTQTISWSEVAGATSYEVRVLKGSTVELQMRVPNERSTIYSFPSGTYSMSVRACIDTCGPYSTPVTFSVALPTLADSPPTITSATAGTDGVLRASWTAVPGADLYLLQVVQPPPAGPGGGALTVASARVSGTTASIPIPPGAASVFVAACNGDGCKANSAPAPISSTAALSAPNVSQPARGASVTGPSVLIAWNRIPGDNGSNVTYRLFVQDLGRQAPALDILTTSNFHGASFHPGSRYDIQVIANPGTPAEVRGPASGFSVRGPIPPAPTVVAPTVDSTVRAGQILIGWTPREGTSLYQYFVGLEGREQGLLTGITSGTEVTVPVTVAPSGLHHNVVVRACGTPPCTAGSDLGWGPWSESIGKFTVIP